MATTRKPAGNGKANGNGKAKERVHVALPQAVEGEEALWPGSARGGGSRNTELRTQLATDLADMEMGSVRRYAVEGDREQKAFVALFRKVCDEVHDNAFGVQAVHQNGAVFVRLGNRRSVTA